MSSILIFSLLVSLFIFPGTVKAADYSAQSLFELARIVRVKTMERSSDFTVSFTGNEEEFNSLFAEQNNFFYYTMVSTDLDDPSTTDDADYIVGNIDFSKDYLSSYGDELHFTPTYFETSSETTYVNQKTQAILSGLGVSGMNNYDKVKTIHDYVCQLITYKDDVEHNSSVYAAYTTGFGLCNSYALCMYKLLTTAGVPCKWIGGTAGTGRDADGHAWNIVELGDKWYALDATWDDASEEVSYDYFLKGLNDFDEADSSQTHTMDAEYTQTEYLKMFPISDSKFNPDIDNDGNTEQVTKPVDSTISTATPTPTNTVNSVDQSTTNTTKTTYQFKNIVSKLKPSTGKTLSVVKGKKAYIYIYLKNKKASNLVQYFSYKVSKGKTKVKVKKYNSIYKSGKNYFLKLRVTGKKKGRASIKMTLTLTNGQKKSYTVNTKVKAPSYYYW